MIYADVIIIGAGLMGCFAARAMAAYDLKTIVLEAREDVCCEISKANSGIIYPGYDNKPETFKAKMCTKSSRHFRKLCSELDVSFRRCGSMMVSYGPRGEKTIAKKLENGKRSGICGLQILTAEEVYEKEPHLAKGITSALYCPDTISVLPWELGIATFENARDNGVAFCFDSKVKALSETDGIFRVDTETESYTARVVINCAGLYADQVRELICRPQVRIALDAADYIVLDADLDYYPKHIIFQETETGKGINLIPTVTGNLLIGPVNRKMQDNKDGCGYKGIYDTDLVDLQRLLDTAREMLPEISEDDVIRCFGAARPNPYSVVKCGDEWVPQDRGINDFPIINEGGLISLIGIKTPGLTCACELGKHIADLAVGYIGHVKKDPHFDPHRKGIRKAGTENGGSVICRCRCITEDEILQAVTRGAKTVDGVRRRTGTCSGRCQGSRCTQAIMEIISRERNIPLYEIEKDIHSSVLIYESPQKK